MFSTAHIYRLHRQTARDTQRGGVWVVGEKGEKGGEAQSCTFIESKFIFFIMECKINIKNFSKKF